MLGTISGYQTYRKGIANSLSVQRGEERRLEEREGGMEGGTVKGRREEG